MIVKVMADEYARAEKLFSKGRYREARALCQVVINIGVSSDTDCQFAIETGGEAVKMIRKIDELTGHTLNPDSTFYRPEEPGRMQKIMNLMKKVCSGCFIRTVLVVVLLVVTARGDEAAHPVRWTEDMGLASVTEIEQRLSAPLALIGDDDDYLELTNGDEAVRISNGIEYIKRIKEGYYPMTRYDSAMERQASGQFMPLALIQKAKPSRVSYLADFALDRINLKDLPQDIMIFSERKPEGYTFHDDCPDAVIEKQTPDLLLWYCLDDPEDSYSKWGYRLKLLAWGDFNDDGVEDVLCEFMYDFVYGSNREAYMAVLTRYSAEDKLKLVSYGEQILRK